MPSTWCSSASPTGSWRGASSTPAGKAECSTCLRELAADLAVGVDELFETHPLEGETYPIDGHEIDLEQLVRDALVLELPLAPACADDCAPADAPGVLVGAATTGPPTSTRRSALGRPLRARALTDNAEPASTRSNRWQSRSARPPGEDASASRLNWRLAAPARSMCPNCGAVKQPHIVCGNCGWYGGRQVIDVE